MLNREASIPISRSEFPHIDEIEKLIEKHLKSAEGLEYGMDVEAQLFTVEMPSGKVLSFPVHWLEKFEEEGPGRVDFYLSMQAQYGYRDIGAREG